MIRYTEKEGEQLWKRRIHWLLGVAFYEMGNLGKEEASRRSGEVLVGSQKFLLGMLEMPIRYSSEDTELAVG